jgi:hypothetical protein
MRDYKSGKIKMLANPMMLTTGFDDPATDCIILARATKSPSLYRQMVGRGLRLYEGKTHAKIIDCAGVIEHQGLPTDPIRPNTMSRTKLASRCPSCESDRIYRIEDEYEGLIRKCADCGYEEQVQQRGCECQHCGAIHGAEANYYTKEGKLYLECGQCGEMTLISTASSAEELREIFSASEIKKIQAKYTIDYINYLYEHSEIDLPFTEEVSRHIVAFQHYIAQHVTDFMSRGLKDILRYYAPFSRSKRNDPEEYKSDWTSEWSWKQDGRLFGIELEAKLLGTDVEAVKQQLATTTDPIETLHCIEKLLNAQGEKSLDTKQKELWHQQLRNSPLEDAGKMSAQRLKDIYETHEPLEEILKFLPMLESVMGRR